MKFVISICLLFVSINLKAQTRFITQIKHIDFGVSTSVHLIYLSNGRIIKSDDSLIIKELNLAMITNKWLDISIDGKRNLLNIHPGKEPYPTILSNPNKLLQESEEYKPSILKSIDQAREFFSEARLNYKESQCYNRAHVWVYDWRVKRNLYSSKIWIYFTPKYIREFDFDWWFHVAPVVHVVIDNAVKERVMDIKYSKGPLKIKQWTDIFMKNLANCPVVSKYTDQADYPESGYCFLMKSSMYYYQPVDLDILEQQGIQKTRWVESEVRHAFEDALEIKI